jgi:hypothetical protein
LTLPNGVRTDPSISMLSPPGGALLGLGPGQSIDWIHDAGQDHRLTVVAILPRRAEHERDANPACTALFSLQWLARRRD